MVTTDEETPVADGVIFDSATGSGNTTAMRMAVQGIHATVDGTDWKKYTERLIAEAIADMGDPDRSSIGSLALPWDVVVDAGAFCRLYESDLNALATSIIEKILEDRSEAALSEAEMHGTEAVYRNALLEYFHWSEIVDPSRDDIAEYSEDPAFSERISYINFVTERPDALPYIDAGLRDMAFIERCLADGVDASLAIGISPSTERVRRHSRV